MCPHWGIYFSTVSNLKARITSLEKRLKVDEDRLEQRTAELYTSRLSLSERVARLEGRG